MKSFFVSFFSRSIVTAVGSPSFSIGKAKNLLRMSLRWMAKVSGARVNSSCQNQAHPGSLGR